MNHSLEYGGAAGQKMAKLMKTSGPRPSPAGIRPGVSGKAVDEVMEMEKDSDLLQFVHKNAEMGKGTIPKVLEMVEEPEMRKALRQQLKEYEDIAGQAEDAIRRRGRKPQDPGAISDAMSEAALHMKTLTDQSPSHIAEMMIRGSTMGTVQMVRRIHNNKDHSDREALDLANRLLKTEESNIQQLKNFL